MCLSCRITNRRGLVTILRQETLDIESRILSNNSAAIWTSWSATVTTITSRNKNMKGLVRNPKYGTSQNMQKHNPASKELTRNNSIHLNLASYIRLEYSLHRTTCTAQENRSKTYEFPQVGRKRRLQRMLTIRNTS